MYEVRSEELATTGGEENYRAIAESIPQLVWLTDADGELRYVNRRWQDYTGMSLAETARQTEPVLIHPADQARLRATWFHCLQSGEPYQIEYRLRRADGEFRWFIVRGLPLRDADGRVMRWFGTCTDIDEQKQAQQALQREREFLRAVLENMVEGVITFDNDGNVTYRNQAARAIDGEEGLLSRSEWSSSWLFYHADGSTLMREEELPLSRVYRGERVQGVEMMIVSRKRAHARRLLVCGEALTDGAGARSGAVVTLLDITERRALEEQFAQAQKMEAVGRLAGGVAHDFNNVLTAILGYSDQLLDELTAFNVSQESVAEIRRACERAGALTRQLLTFSRKQVVAPRILDLNDVVGNIEKMLRCTIGDDIRLSLRLQPGLGAVRADPVQMEQVLLNLAVNARDAMPQGGRLVVETCDVTLDEEDLRGQVDLQPGPFVRLSVCDTGSGIPAEVLAHIFEPFFTTKELGKGTGLGLSTVYGIVKECGGHILVESRAEVGTTFRLYFPRTAEPVPPPEPSLEIRQFPCGTETLFLVEDDPSVRFLLRRTLQKVGYTVLDVGHPGEALQLAINHKHPIDLLVTDVVLPLFGGSRLAEKLQTLHPEMKVLFVSGHTTDELLRYGVRHDQTPFLAKPFSPLALARTVRQVLDA
jgi:PAS domain S-box-containing protein